MSRLVLFVCTGNVCRSPMAQVLFNAKAHHAGDGDQLIAESAGTWAPDGQAASSNAVSVMKKHGLDLTQHRARTITGAMLDQAAVILVMTKSHAEAITCEFPSARNKIHLMSELQARTFDIGDPYGSALAEYESAAQQLDKLIDTGYAQIKTWIFNTP